MSNPAFSGGIGVIAGLAPPSVLPPPLIPVVITGPVSSAGVFDSNNVLVRTLWSASVNDPRIAIITGPNQASVWDGTLDNGTTAPAGNYTIGLLTNNVGYTWEGAIGNSSPDHTNVVATTPVPNAGNDIVSYYLSYGAGINDMAITAAGEMYFVTSYDERDNTMHVATTANPQYANGILAQGFRNTFTNQLNCCTDGINTYFHYWDGTADGKSNGVWAISCSTKFAITFPSGTGSIGGGNFLGLSNTSQFIFGIAVQPAANYIFIARSEASGALSTTWSIWTCDKTTGATVVKNLLGYAFQNRICINPSTGDLWVIHTTQTASPSATWDPLTAGSVTVQPPAWTFSNGNRTVANGLTESIYAYSTGNGTKVYFEVVQNANPNGVTFANPVGVASTLGGRNSQGFLGDDANSAAFYGNGSTQIGGGSGAGGTPTWGVGDNVGIACDMTLATPSFWVRVNGGNWNGSPTANPATGTGGISIATIGATGTPIVAAIATDTVGPNSQLTGNFATTDWTYTAPSGFSAVPGFTRTPSVSKLTVNASTGVLTDSGIAATTGLIAPAAVAISPDGSMLLVADAGASQQIKAFNTSDGSAKTAWNGTGVLGDAGGYANGPAVSNTRYMFKGVEGADGGSNPWITFAPDASFWFGDAGNSRYMHFSSGNSPTFIENMSYFPLFYSAWVCRNDPTRVFGGYLEFKIDYTKTLQPGNGSWTLVNNWFFGVPAGYNHYGAMRYTLTGTNGRTYVPIPAPGPGTIFELTSTGYRTASVPNVQYDYIDANFNLWRIPGGGPGSTASWYYNQFTGFDSSNNPTWANSPTSAPPTLFVTSQTLPTAFPTVRSQSGVNDSSNASETLANGVIPVYDLSVGSSVGNHFGGIDSATGNVKFSTHFPIPLNNGGPNYFLTFPQAPFYGVQPGGPLGGSGVVSGGGFWAFVPGKSDAFTLYRGEGWGQNQASVWSHWDQSGLLVNRFGVGAPYFGIFYSTVDIPPLLNASNLHTVAAAPNGTQSLGRNQSSFGFMGTLGLAGNTFGGQIAFTNGNYYIYHGDEWYHGGVHRWKVSNLSTINISNIPISWNGIFVPPTPNPYNFLAGLPYNTQNLPNGSGGWTRNPTSDTGSSGSPPFFLVFTNAINCDPHSPPDLVMATQFGNPYTASLSYSWTRIGSGSWTISGSICGGVFSSRGEDGITHLYIDILDPSGKKIVRMENLNTSGGVSFFVNGSAITPQVPDGSDVWQAWIAQVQPLNVHYNSAAGTITVSYAGFSISGITVFDAGANIANPGQFMLTYAAVGAGPVSPISICVTSMQFADS